MRRLSDAELAGLYSLARASLFPSLAERLRPAASGVALDGRPLHLQRSAVLGENARAGAASALRRTTGPPGPRPFAVLWNDDALVGPTGSRGVLPPAPHLGGHCAIAFLQLLQGVGHRIGYLLQLLVRMLRGDRGADEILAAGTAGAIDITVKTPFSSSARQNI